jgi:hypothetical protein
MFRRWLRALARRWFPRRWRRVRLGWRPVWLFVEPLEERILLSTIVVNNPTDAAVANETSLRQAITTANTDAAAGQSDTIVFDASLGSHTITLTQGPLHLSGAGAGIITIDGSSPSTPLTVSGNNALALFQIDAGVQAVLTNLNLEDGSAAGNGGAIVNAGTLTLSNANLLNNAAAAGGAVENTGELSR